VAEAALAGPALESLMATRLYGSAGLEASATERAALARQRARAAGVADPAAVADMTRRMARVHRLVRQEEQERERVRRPTPRDPYVSSTLARLFFD
jgi:hypothetical protein